MPSQNDFDRISRCITDPIVRHWGVTLDTDTVSDFVDDLSRYDEQTLNSAMAKLRQEQKRRPSLAHVVEACKQCQHKVSENYKQSPSEGMPWTERDRRRRKLVADYVQSFKSCDTYFAASRGVYEVSLMNYVSEVAWIQAQMIDFAEGTCGIGWSSVAIFGAGATITDDDIKRLFADCQCQAGMGFIDVPIPTTKLAEWQRHADWVKLHNAPHESRIAKTARPTLSGLDAEINRRMGGKA